VAKGFNQKQKARLLAGPLYYNKVENNP